MKRLLINTIKLYPVIINLWILIIMLSFCFGISSDSIRNTYVIFGQSFISNFLIFTLSLSFHFCVWHRILICSMSCVLLMEVMYKFGIHIPHFAYVSITIIVLSLIVSAILYYKHGCHSKKKVNIGVKIPD